MKDTDARGLILHRLYDLRNENPWVDPKQLADLSLEEDTLGRITEQLVEHRLVEWKPVKSGRRHGAIEFFLAKITAKGVDVVEGTATPPIAIHIVDKSVNVHDSQNVMIYGKGNVQNVNLDIEKMIVAVDGANVSLAEKQEAKSLLAKISENKLVQTILVEGFKKVFGM